MDDTADFLSGIGAEPKRRTKRATKQRREPLVDKPRVTLPDIDWQGFVKRNARQIALSTTIAVVVGAVSVNAVFLQDNRHPSPLFAHSFDLDEGVSLTTTAAIPTPSSREIVLNSEGAPVADPLILEIQSHLAERGYYDAAVDGVIGSRTRKAIATYQAAFAQNVDEVPSNALLQHIKLSSADPVFHELARSRIEKAQEIKDPAANSTTIIKNTNDLVFEDRETIVEVQQALTALGIDALKADGVIGPRTREAVRVFERQRNLPVTGHITTSVLSELGRLGEI